MGFLLLGKEKGEDLCRRRCASLFPPAAESAEKRKGELMTERIEKLRKMHRSGHAAISVERLILATEAYQKYAGEPIWIFRAHVLEYVLDRKAVVIRDGEGKTPSGPA